MRIAFWQRESLVKYFFLLPAVLWTTIFTIFPLLYSLVISFYNIRLGKPWQFVGVKNFVRVFTDYRVMDSLHPTLVLVLGTVTTELIVGMVLALIFHREMGERLRRILRTCLTLPLFATPVAIGFLSLTIFYEEGGPLNSLLAFFGTKIPWLSDPFWALLSIFFVETWLSTPFCFLVLLAGLQGLPEEVYEAGSLDYSSQWHLFWKITFPLMLPVITITFLLRLINAFKIFAVPHTLTGGGPGKATEVYSMLTFYTGLRFFDFGFSSALAYVMLAVIAVIATFVFRRMREVYE
jgi:multiple sugar transport system permease protein